MPWKMGESSVSPSEDTKSRDNRQTVAEIVVSFGDYRFQASNIGHCSRRVDFSSSDQVL